MFERRSARFNETEPAGFWRLMNTHAPKSPAPFFCLLLASLMVGCSFTYSEESGQPPACGEPVVDEDEPKGDGTRSTRTYRITMTLAAADDPSAGALQEVDPVVDRTSDFVREMPESGE